ncbi:uncharacterized protein EV420DRAFT_1527086, partial [Desarmillaria tabescens]
MFIFSKTLFSMIVACMNCGEGQENTNATRPQFPEHHLVQSSLTGDQFTADYTITTGRKVGIYRINIMMNKCRWRI